jgi:hypothetical protein
MFAVCQPEFICVRHLETPSAVSWKELNEEMRRVGGYLIVAVIEGSTELDPALLMADTHWALKIDG